MSTVGAVAAAATTTPAGADISNHAACLYALKRSHPLSPTLVASVAPRRCRDIIGERGSKILVLHKPLPNISSIKSNSNWLSSPKLSLCASFHGLHQQLHAFSSKGKPFSHLFSTSASLLGGQDGLPSMCPISPRKQRLLDPSRACKNDYFSFRCPVITEKPEWWWRTLACIPYLIALQLSDAGYYLQPFLGHYNWLEDLIFYVPGAISRLPVWFSMLYIYFAYIGIVKNKEWPHYFRFHLMMGMLLETALQIVWYTSNFMPLIHYNGRFGMHYWAGIGLAYIVILLQCIGCALAGGYAHFPFVSDAAYIHTLFNIGGYQRPF
ncbi:hypothetical protein K2173_001718 [Erythroxylum novogranatense]|uniref:Protein TIC 20 n=1 Tax=Erythroxylum novogranatense TaxID=1862640 RepID=A0AAV8S822_9ROSI|nr:hypothetical protein K2173_001718 [Erythroxylum novogranatense]